MTYQHTDRTVSDLQAAARRRRLHTAWLLLGACAMAACTAHQPTDHPSGAQPLGFDLQGHRGARGDRPENTLVAFDHAMTTGVATLELDIGITRDGVAVISHDPKLNPAITRDETGQWLPGEGPALWSLTLSQLQRYDVGRIKPGVRYAQTFAQQQPQDGERIPTLASLFDRVQARGAMQMRFNIETKINPEAPDGTADPATFVRTILDVARAKGVLSRVTIQSFDWRTLRESRRVAPDVPTACLTVRQNWMDNVGSGKWTAGITLGEHGGVVPRMVKAAGCSIWSPYFGDVDAPLMAEARRLGLKVVPWTVNQPADIDRMLDLKPDGLITDYPARARAALAARGMVLPAPIR